MTKKRELTEMQQKFLDVLFGEEAKGDPVAAKKLAGYTDGMPTSRLTASLQDEIYELTKKFIAQSSTKAAYTMYTAMGSEIMMGAKERMAAAKDIMDRAGLAKTERVEIVADQALFILPAKRSQDDDNG
jgi:hypothetical protein